MENKKQEEDQTDSSDYTSEDEGTEDYRRGGYHAVRIGDSFKNGRYVVQTKLGWGHFSTVWLAWDTQFPRYVALKVQKSAQHYTEAAMDEITILKQIAEGDPDDNKCVVKLLDHFKHSGPNGQHVCMIFEYLGDNLLTLIKYTDYRGLPIHKVKEICFHILVGLDYLHKQLSIIHTDLKPENILLLSMIDPSKDPRKSGLPLILPANKDKATLESGVSKEIKSLNGDLTKNHKRKIRRKAKQAAQGCVEKEMNMEAEADPDISDAVESSPNAKLSTGATGDKPTSSLNANGLSDTDVTKGGREENEGNKKGSRLRRKMLLASADLNCKLVDFGNACWTYKQFTNDIQTRQYRCPEVILGSKYSTSADLWSFACICFELATGDVLFDPHSGDNFDRDEVYQLSIGAACGLSWPSDRIIIQVLDDSTDPIIKDLVEMECQRWGSKGINIKYEIRDNRNGYKAGALKEGMKRSYVKECDYVAIFDADFQPEPDFLWRTIPFLLHNSRIALVQARWKFVNSNECLMTRMQEMSLNYHFTVEQEVGSSTHAFFGFNGTAGVWRIAALNESGGWKDRTTVEDMDLAVRASLKGWKFLYLGNLQVKNELPSTFKAYRYQQHRWSCGPANLFRKMVMEIIRNKKVTLWKKVHVIYSFFFVRKVIAHINTFIFYCIVMPATVLVPEVVVPKWGAVYIPSIITLLNAIGTPRSFHLLVFWILFENVMSFHRTKATIIGLLEASRVNEWIVTEKLGDAFKAKAASKASKKPRFRIGERLHLGELGVGAYLFFCGVYDVFFGKNHYFIFLFIQAIAFFITGFGYVGTFVPSA